jgi:hypothetical protein
MRAIASQSIGEALAWMIALRRLLGSAIFLIHLLKSIFDVKRNSSSIYLLSQSCFDRI